MTVVYSSVSNLEVCGRGPVGVQFANFSVCSSDVSQVNVTWSNYEPINVLLS